jgi:protein-tyrosine phosphatase
MQKALSLLRKITDALEEDKNVAIHCRQGVGRSGSIATGVLVTSGIGVEKAIETVSTARGQTVPETPTRVQWIHHLPTERPVVTS